ncbi:MAG: hypothetical protein ACYTGN_00440 [Planctomycetota bacterium]|jgi:hypothetical protein
MKYATFLVLLLAACSNKAWYSDLQGGECFTSSSLEQDAGGWVVVLKRQSGDFLEIPLGKDPQEGKFYKVETLGRPIRVGTVHDGFTHVAAYHHGRIDLDRFDGETAKGSYEANRQPSPISGSFKASK